MNDNVVFLDHYRPHVVIDCSDESGKVHVMPVSCLEDFVRGEGRLPPDVLRQIAREWLAALGAPGEQDPG